jgi:hypothetical protein
LIATYASYYNNGDYYQGEICAMTDAPDCYFHTFNREGNIHSTIGRYPSGGYADSGYVGAFSWANQGKLITLGSNGGVLNSYSHACYLSTNVPNVNLTKIRLTNTPDGASSYGVRIHAAYLFNRVVTQAEKDYIYNFGNLNIPITLEGCFGAFTFDNAAEIVTVNGVQMVGVKNEIYGQKDAYFVGLPAGNLTTQLAYANANYIIS